MTPVTQPAMTPVIYYSSSASGTIHHERPNSQKGDLMTELSPEMVKLQQSGIELVIHMIELQLDLTAPLLIDPIINRSDILQAGSMFQDLANLALSFGMDGTVARKLNEMASVLAYILSSEAMFREYGNAREQLVYILERYKPNLRKDN
jgi:hypothetical protein